MIQSILSCYDIPAVDDSVPLGNAGGFSGSALWKVATSQGVYCLRRWPDGFAGKKLDWIHRVLRFAAANGCPEVVIPLESRRGRSFVEMAGFNWELNCWADGIADFNHHPTSARLKAASECLARFHLATARFSFNFGPSPNVNRVVQRLTEFDTEINRIESSLPNDTDLLTLDDWRYLRMEGPKLSASTLKQLEPLGIRPLPVQPVIRDIRAEHLFFAGDAICNIIDFGAMQIDSVACDLARMLGSLIGHDSKPLGQAIEAYHQVRPLSFPERQLIEPMNRAGDLVGILNWLNWIFLEKRRFESRQVVKNRLVQLFQRLRNQH